MKIALITTLPSLIENKRIEEEVRNLGHEFQLIDMADFSFSIDRNGINVPQLSNLEAEVAIVRGVFLAIKTISEIVESLRIKGTKIFDNNFLEHRYSIDKVTDLVKLTLKSIRVPDTSYNREFQYYEKEAEKLAYPLVIKSARMGKGVGVYKVDSKDELRELIDNLESEGKNAKGYLMQRFIPYKYDLRVLVIGEKVFTMRRIPAIGEFRANFSLGGSVEKFEPDEEGRKLAIEALNAVGMSVGGVDILITEDDQRYILEVNHTAGFVGMEKATSENIGKVYVEHAIAEAK